MCTQLEPTGRTQGSGRLLGAALCLALGSCSVEGQPPTPPESALSSSAPTSCEPLQSTAQVARALADELLRRRSSVEAFAGLQPSMLESASSWDVRYGERQARNPKYREQLRAYEREMKRRRAEDASGAVRLRHAISPPSEFHPVLGSDGLDLEVRFGADTPSGAPESTVEPVRGSEGINLRRVTHWRVWAEGSQAARHPPIATGSSLRASVADVEIEFRVADARAERAFIAALLAVHSRASCT